MFTKERQFYKKAFFYALFGAAIIFIPLIIFDKGYFLFYGDYNAQQIPFYRITAQSIKSGNFFWDWHTDLGTNFIGSYTFYTLGSPFFWLSMIVPASWTHFVMGPLMMLKFACASLFAFTYIRRFTKTPDFALIGGLLYAFSGFSAYNVFFNHFHEAIVFFPLLLIGLEELIVNKRRGVFALVVAANALVNYFFFIGSAIFVVIYFFVRILDPKIDFTVRDIFTVGFEAVIGVAIAGVLFIPSIAMVLENPRSTTMLTGWDLVFYSNEQRYGLVLQSLFFPPDIAARQNFFPQTGARWSSVAGYLPLFSMAGVLAFLKGAKRNWLKYMIPLCFLFMLIPGFNSMFSLFNDNYYTRWLYMPVLLCAMATVIALEDKKYDLLYGLKWCVFAVALISMVTILPSIEQTEVVLDDGTKSKSQVEVIGKLVSEAPAVYISIAIAFAMIAVCMLLLKKRGNNPLSKKFKSSALYFTLIACIVSSGYTIVYGRAIGPYNSDYSSALYADIKIDDYEFFRVESVGDNNNVHMFWDLYGFRSFHSLVPKGVFDMYDLVGFERSVNSDSDTINYMELRMLSSVKYVMISDEKIKYAENKAVIDKLKGFEKVDYQNGYTILENQNFIPMGFAYDYYLDVQQFAKKPAVYKDNLLLKAAHIPVDIQDKYSDILKELPLIDYSNTSEFDTISDAKELRENGIESFKTVKNGFTATTNYDEDKLVMFSVPYDSGWSAKINGQDAEFDVINGGFIGMRVPAGENLIEFSYISPGFWIGLITTGAGLLVLGIYILIWIKTRKQKPNRYIHLYDKEVVVDLVAHDSYIEQMSKHIYQSKDNSDFLHLSGIESKVNWDEINEKIQNAFTDENVTLEEKLDQAQKILDEINKKDSKDE